MRIIRIIVISTFFALSGINSASLFAQGIFLRATSAASEGMAGVAVANPIDSAGAMYQNPASIAAFKKSEMSFGMGIIMAKSEVSSSVPGLGSGTTRSSTGSLPSPSMSMIMKSPGSPLTLGFAMGGVGGAATLYERDFSNPIMMGNVRTSNVQILQMMPTAAYEITPRLSIGISPVVSMGKLEISPSGIANHPELDPAPTHATNVGTRYIWGAGVNAGIYYDTCRNWKFGFAVKSPQWCEKIMVYDNIGNDLHSHALDLDLPMIISTGCSYTGIKDTILAVDIRYMDYGNIIGFKDGGYDSDGAFLGLGWRSIMVVAVGVQHQLNERLILRAGYCYNQNPIRNENQVYNVPSPLAMEHSVHVGTGFFFGRDWELSLAYTHAFKNGGTGPLYSSQGAVIGTVSNKAAGSTILAGVTKRF